MKRRQFLNGLTAATISGVAMIGCNTNNPQNNAQLATPSPTPTADCTGGDPEEICYKTQMLMIFALAFSQKDFRSKVLFVNEIFPNTGTVNFPGHAFAKLGIDPAALKAFRDGVIKSDVTRTPKQIRDTFNTINGMFSQLVTYTGSECPSQASLNKMIAYAKDQHV